MKRRETPMLHEITGAQLALLLDAQKARMRETTRQRNDWRLGRIVKQALNNTLGRRVPANTFLCEHCGKPVPAVAPGARQRSHCPHCLWGLHETIDRAGSDEACRGLMEPVEVATEPGGTWSIVHCCRRCHATEIHSIAVDDSGTALLLLASRTRKARPAGAR